jgi:ribosomal protein L28
MPANKFSEGDFVVITGSHPESGKRGYVFEAARDDNSRFGVGIDECQLPKTSHPPPIHVAANCLKLIRKHGSIVVTDLSD